MSSKINSKDIINKQKEKYADSPWNEFLLKEFDKPAFEKMLNKLIDGVGNGKNFMPPMKSWFDDFAKVSIEDLKVLIISKGPIEFPSEFKSQEFLFEQGVMFLNLSRTSVGTDQMMEDWRLFNINFVDHVFTTNKNVIYVFVGFDASNYSDLISDEVTSNKIFLPETSHSIWKSNLLHSLFSKNVNTLLESTEIDTINW